MEVGTIIETPYGWGILESYDSREYVCIHLDWRAECYLPLCVAATCRRSFAPLGTCVETKLGYGVLLDYRKSDGVHKVCLWRRRGRGSSMAWLQWNMFICTLAAIPGFPVVWSGSQGVAKLVTPDGVEVALPFGTGYWTKSKISCPLAKVMPVVDLFLGATNDLVAANEGLLRKLREAIESAGLLDPNLHKQVLLSVQDAISTVTGIVENGGSAETLAIAVSNRLCVDAELKRLLRLGMDCVKKLDYAENPMATSLFMRHWSLQPSTLANYVDVAAPLDAIYQLESSLQQGSWWEYPSTLANRVEINKSAQFLSNEMDGIMDLVPDRMRVTNITTVIDKLQQVAREDPFVQEVLDKIEAQMQSLATVGKEIQETRVARALVDGASRIQSRASEERVAFISRSSESLTNDRVALRGKRFMDRLQQEKSEVQAKVFDIASAGMDRYASAIPMDRIEEWIAYIKQVVEQSWDEYRVKLFASLQCFDMQESVLQLMWVDPKAFPRAIEDVLAQSSVAQELSGTHLRNLYYKNQADVTEFTSRSLLHALEISGVYIPEPIIHAVAAATSGDNTQIAGAVVKTLDAEDSVERVNMVLAKGEDALDKLMEYAKQPPSATSAAIMNAVLDKIDDDQIEDSIFSSIKQLDTKTLLAQAEDVFNQSDALSKFANDIKDSVLQFILEILPALEIPRIDDVCEFPYAGTIKYSIDKLDMSGFRFRKEDVQLSFPPSENTFVVEISAKNVSATFTNLEITLKQLGFPYIKAEPIACADAQGICLDLQFTMDETNNLVLSSRNIEIASLSLHVDAIGFAFVVNALTSLFTTVIKNYVKVSLEEKLDENIDPLLETLNGYVDGLPETLRAKLRQGGTTVTLKRITELDVDDAVTCASN
eukprot:GEMP01017607.1.p1 GENE.GEMP01017607.1~~GEMP01017607.1.p1  ORF type:complete len:883 (+),score=190.38 GEMP01017607.1:137-2785(+)